MARIVNPGAETGTDVRKSGRSVARVLIRVGYQHALIRGRKDSLKTCPNLLTIWILRSSSATQHFWVLGEDAPCIAGIGNWLDPTTDAFVTRNNIQLVVKASGRNPRTGHQPPSWGYGLNRFTGRQPIIIELPINNERYVHDHWLEACVQILHVWLHWKEGHPRP